MKIAIANDHAANNLAKSIMDFLAQNNIQYFNCCVEENNAEYPDHAKAVVEKILNKSCDFGILICGTGVGMSISANRHKGIRAALCTDSFTAKATRKHNDANILCLGERVVGSGLALDIVNDFLNTNFEGGRHIGRIQKIDDLCCNCDNPDN